MAKELSCVVGVVVVCTGDTPRRSQDEKMDDDSLRSIPTASGRYSVYPCPRFADPAKSVGWPGDSCSDGDPCAIPCDESAVCRRKEIGRVTGSGEKLKVAKEPMLELVSAGEG